MTSTLTDAETVFCEKSNQLKAIGDILSAVAEDLLRDETLAYVGHIIIDLARDIDTGFYVVLDQAREINIIGGN